MGCSHICLSAQCIIQRLFSGNIIIRTRVATTLACAGKRMLLGGDTVEVEVPCNWFKVDAISAQLKRRLDRDIFRGEDEARRNEKQEGAEREKSLSLLSRSRVVMIEHGLLSVTPIDRKAPL